MRTLRPPSQSDEEKKARGTFDPRYSEEARGRRLSDKLFAGPGYQDVPDPENPLTDYEQKIYFELCGQLLRQGKLTMSTRDIAEEVALLKGSRRMKIECGLKVPAYITRDIMNYSGKLKLVEDTSPIGGNVSFQPKANVFDVCGTLLAPFAKGGLRETAAA